ncbi:sigma-54-dependent transcriptional regulator [Actomonas aquatica]|uniref:Sigma-54 dependent transcriptional regulator n=1 Tax=Actomonas aquatica TaxID=2866162 RepID=A0ABZ1CDJ9_9BACT|nr:sigma-54 dependent transcriptional regulator [Opitutus sp. WL0086]WRQ89757.1 sigma-54 dependent transcriptional regulator [Opitutus sp. WL0086]
MPSVLIVDDLLSIHEMLDAVIQPTGYSTAFATDGEKGLARYKEERFDLVLADIDMKPMDGITLLKQLKTYDPSAVVIIMTAYASTESAIQALKFGAFDYLQKPFRVDELISTLRRGIEFREFQLKRASSAAPEVDVADLESRLVGSSREMQRLRQQVQRLANARTPVLLQGEMGTGKDAIAELLHASSAEDGAQLVRIDCALSSEANFERGLMGENGAGGEWVQQACGGTLLLERLESLPFEMQQELVSVLRNTAHRFRLICTTTADLELMTDEGRFHDELFYRVASLPVSLPPLREHLSDLPEFIRHILAKSSNPHFDAKLIEFSPEALAVLEGYRWPGNMMELNQVVTKIAASTEARLISAEQLPMRLKELSQWPSLADHLAEQRKQYIEMVLHACRGDRGEASRVLGIDISELG